MQTQSIKVSKLKSNPNNPRVIKDDKFLKLVKSIEEFPDMLDLRPVVIDENNMVLGGNMRLKAIKHLGIKDVPVVIAEGLTENEKQQFIVKDNTNYGEWNLQAIKEFGLSNLEDWGFTEHNFLEDEEPKYQAPEYEEPQPLDIDMDAEAKEHIPSLKLLLEFNIKIYDEAVELVSKLTEKNVDLEALIYDTFQQELENEK